MNQSDPTAERYEAWRETLAAALRALGPSDADGGYGTLVPYSLGGPDPLPYVHTVARATPDPRWLYMSAGFSEPQDGDAPGGPSGYGFELTVRVPRDPAHELAPTEYVVALQTLARYVFRTGNVIANADYLDASGMGLDVGFAAFAAVADPELTPLETSHGTIAFLTLVGLDARELDAVKAWSTVGFLEAALAAGKFPKDYLLTPGRSSTLDDPAFAAAVAAGGKRDGSQTGVLFVLGLALETTARILRGPRYEVRFDANEAATIAAVLPNRIAFDRRLRLLGNGVSVRFEPAPTATLREEDGLVVGLTAADATALSEALRRGETAIEVAALPLRVVVGSAAG